MEPFVKAFQLLAVRKIEQKNHNARENTQKTLILALIQQTKKNVEYQVMQCILNKITLLYFLTFYSFEFCRYILSFSAFFVAVVTFANALSVARVGLHLSAFDQAELKAQNPEA